MKYKMVNKTLDELLTIVKNQDEYNQLYISETKEELKRRGQDIQLSKLEESYQLQKEKLKILKDIEIEEQNLSNKKIRYVLKWIFFIPVFIAIRPIMRSINWTPFERVKQLLTLVCFLFIIYFILTRVFFPIKRIKNK